MEVMMTVTMKTTLSMMTIEFSRTTGHTVHNTNTCDHIQIGLRTTSRMTCVLEAALCLVIVKRLPVKMLNFYEKLGACQSLRKAKQQAFVKEPQHLKTVRNKDRQGFGTKTALEKRWDWDDMLDPMTRVASRDWFPQVGDILYIMYLLIPEPSRNVNHYNQNSVIMQSWKDN